jgi:hypothetical protein
MPKSAYISAGSNTTVKTGPGFLYGAVVGGGANGGSAFFVNSISIGATPNYVTQLSDSSNIAVVGPVGVNGGDFPLYGAPFSTGLTVSATSNAPVTVAYD